MPPINISINANTQGVQRQMTTLERFMSGVAKRLDGLFNKGGSAQGVNALTKQMQALTKATDAQVQKVKTLQAALQNVNQQMGGAQGANVAGLQAQQKLLQRQFQNANNRLGVLQQMGSAAAQRAQAGGQGSPGAGGAGGGGGAAGGGSSAVGNLLGMGGKALTSLPIVGSLIGAGVLGIAGKAYETSADNQKKLADLLPRLLGGHGANQGRFLGRDIAQFGQPMGFTRGEDIAAASAMSTGGFRGVGGLKRDTQTAMQMSRLFGIDVGQQAGTLAEGARMGAFKPGDAKKFAGMLATEIAKTGLGPRAQEVQEATLMLLNSQLRTQPSANAGPIMALQTLFNKTGLPAFTGTRGASVINQLNESVTNPRGEAQEALNQQVFMKMGARGFFQMQEMKEQGLSNPKYLPSLISTLRKGTGNREEFLTALMGQTGIPLLQLEGLEKTFGKGLTGLTQGRMGQAEKMLKSGGIDLPGGAKATMDLTGNKIRVGEATVDELMNQLGDVLAKHLGDAAKWFGDRLNPIFKALDGDTKDLTTSIQQMKTWEETYLPGLPGVGPVAGNPGTPGALKGIESQIAIPPGQEGKYLPSAPANLGLMGIAHKFGLHPTSGLRKGAHTVTGKSSLHSRGTASDPGAIDFGGTAAGMDAAFDMLRQTFGDAAFNELIDGRKGMIKNGRYYSPGHFPGKHGAELQAQHMGHLHASMIGMGEGGHSTLTIKVQHDGSMTPQAQAHFEKHVEKAVTSAARVAARVQPNKRNTRQ